MRYSRQRKVAELASPPRKRRTPPSEQTDEAPVLIEKEQVDIEREIPLGDKEPVERGEPRDRPDPPLFED